MRVEIMRAAVRAAEEGDAAAIVAIYAPYVKSTATSFEIEPPTTEVMAQRIVGTLETHPWLVAECGGQIVGFFYAGKHRERPYFACRVSARPSPKSSCQTQPVSAFTSR